LKRRPRENYLGLGREGKAPGEEIEAAAPAGGRCSGGGGAAQVEKGGGVARGVEGLKGILL
jgi:hypothetical protein